MIRLENITLTFGSEKVLDNISFHIKKGESICFWGLSGSGKTSLLKLILGTEIPDSGSIVINNTKLETESIKEIRAQISWIPQNINLPVENANELLEMLELNPNQKKKFHTNTKRLGLDESIIQKSFHEISGGQKQRIVIAAVLSLDKPILILDEPTSALDQESANKLIELILDNEELTVISASHDKKWCEINDNILKL